MKRARKRFGQRVQRLRKRKGFTQEELAKRAKLHPTHLSRIERGMREPRLTTILQLKKGLQVTADELLEGLEDSSEEEEEENGEF